MDLKFEKKFLKEIISDFKKVLVFLDTGIFGKLFFQQAYKASVNQIQNIKLNVFGTVAFLYILKYKESFPLNATTEQQKKINEIWIAMKMPENVVPV